MSCITVCFIYSIRIAIFLNTDISQGSVATRRGCGGVFTYDFVTNFLLSLTVKKKLKIGQYLMKLWARIRCLVFDSQCSYIVLCFVSIVAVSIRLYIV